MSAAASDASIATFGEAAAESKEDQQKGMEITEDVEMVVKTKQRQRSVSQTGARPRIAA